MRIGRNADWKECNLYRTKYQSLESDSESEMTNDVDNVSSAKFIGYLEGSKESEETFSDEKEVRFIGQTPPEHKKKEGNSTECPICQLLIAEHKEIGIPASCSCVFHHICLEEWLKTSDDGSILCPVCQSVFSEIKSSLPLDCTLEDVTSNLLELSDPDNLYVDIPLIVNMSVCVYLIQLTITLWTTMGHQR